MIILITYTTTYTITSMVAWVPLSRFAGKYPALYSCWSLTPAWHWKLHLDCLNKCLTKCQILRILFAGDLWSTQILTFYYNGGSLIGEKPLNLRTHRGFLPSEATINMVKQQWSSHQYNTPPRWACAKTTPSPSLTEGWPLDAYPYGNVHVYVPGTY